MLPHPLNLLDGDLVQTVLKTKGPSKNVIPAAEGDLVQPILKTKGPSKNMILAADGDLVQPVFKTKGPSKNVIPDAGGDLVQAVLKTKGPSKNVIPAADGDLPPEAVQSSPLQFSSDGQSLNPVGQWPNTIGQPAVDQLRDGRPPLSGDSESPPTLTPAQLDRIATNKAAAKQRRAFRKASLPVDGYAARRIVTGKRPFALQR